MDNLTPYLFFATLFIGYGIRRKAYLGPVDPLQAIAVSESVWVVTVYELARDGAATNHQATMFGICLLLWWASWWYAARHFGSVYRESITAFWQRLSDMPHWRKRRMLILYLVGLSILILVTLANGGGGDNRLTIMKLLKPLESVTTILVPAVLFNLLISQRRYSKPLLAAVLVGMIITGGKSAILSILIPVTGASLIGRIRLQPRVILGLIVVSLIGFCASAMINYDVSNPIDALQLLYFRISLEADVYLLALPSDLLPQTQITSLTTYLLGPLIKLLFLPIDVDTNIGAQIGSIISGTDTVNGPNPHWPIVLLAYNKSIITSIFLSIICFGIVLNLKFKLSRFSQKRRWPMWAMIPVHGYILIYPQTFFADPSFPLIYLIQAGILAIFLSVVLRPVRSRVYGEPLYGLPGRPTASTSAPSGPVSGTRG